jgi:hypothetical protein
MKGEEYIAWFTSLKETDKHTPSLHVVLTMNCRSHVHASHLPSKRAILGNLTTYLKVFFFFSTPDRDSAIRQLRIHFDRWS